MASKTLYILRHAQAAPPGGDDKARPLSPEGKKAVQALAQAMQAKSYTPSLALCSPARRTRETCAAVCGGAEMAYEDALYLASTGSLYERLKQIGDEHDRVLLVGHNPGIHGLVQMLVGEGEPALIHKILGGYRAGCLSVIDCDCVVWSELLPGGNRLRDLLIGEELA